MTSDEAYHTICNTFQKDPKIQIISSFLDVDNFGNFVVEFVNEADRRAIICDRDQVHVCSDSSGTRDCSLLVQSLYDTTEQELVDTLQRISVSSK